MNLKKLLDLFEAPANLNYKGTAGTQAIQQATNQAKPGAIKNVNIIKPGQQLALPGGGSYTVKAGDTMDKIAKSNPPAAIPTATTATAPVTNAVAPSTDNETLKGQVITKAMSPAAPATAPANQAAMSYAGNNVNQPEPTVPAADSLSAGEEIVNTPPPAATAPAPEPEAPAAVAAAPATQSGLPPRAQLYGYVSEEDEELNELMRLSGRPVNEKAVSKQQQKFMGMVHAMQKGKKIKGASPELKKVAKTMSKKDAKDFASTKHKGLPTKVSESVMLEAGSALEHIINKFKHETKNFLAGEELDHDLFEALFDYYADNGEMPYGVAKARDGDPYQWIDNKFEQDLSMMGHQRDFNTAGLGHDHELTELARLAGLTNEDGPGSAMLNAPKKDTDSFADRMRSAGKEIRRTIDRATLPSAMHAEYDRIEAEKDKRATAPIATPSVTKADALTGTNPASAAERPVDLPTYPRNVKEDEELNRMRRIAGLDEARGAPEIGSKLPKSDVETFGLEPGRTYKIETPKDWKHGSKPRALQQVIPTADKKDHIRSRLGKHTQPNLPEGMENLDEHGDSPLNRLNQMPQSKGQEPSSGAASSFAPRERERVVSPKIDKYDKDKEKAEKERRDIVDRESPDANTFGRKIGKAIASPFAAAKSAWHGATDAWDHEMGNDTAPDPKPPSSVIPASKWKGDKDNPSLKENDELNRMRKIAGLQECGDMGMSSQQDSMNVSTNMSSDGTKSVTISAQGDQAAALVDMLRLAGMDSSHVAQDSEPEIVMVSGNEELEESVNYDKVLDAIAALFGDDIWDSDVMQDLANDLEQASPTDQELDFIISQGRLPKRLAGIQFAAGDDVQFREEADRVTQYSNTPEEEYETVHAITRQGNDLNREKRQYAGKPKLGDNPMAESLLDADLDAMLESILIREDDNDNAAKKAGDAAKNPSDAAKEVGDKVKGRLSFSKDAEGKTSIKSSTGRIRATIDGNKTHYEPGEPAEKEKTDEGWMDDVSDFVGDVVGTEASKLRHSQQLRDLDAMRQQYKGTPYEKQVNDRYQTHLDRLQADKGEVVDKKGEPIKVLPPDQWKGGN